MKMACKIVTSYFRPASWKQNLRKCKDRGFVVCRLQLRTSTLKNSNQHEQNISFMSGHKCDEKRLGFHRKTPASQITAPLNLATTNPFSANSAQYLPWHYFLCAILHIMLSLSAAKSACIFLRAFSLAKHVNVKHTSREITL